MSAAQDLNNAFGEAGVAEVLKLIPANKVEELCAKISVANLRLMVTAFTIPRMFGMLQALSISATADILTKFTPAEMKALAGTIGIPRFTDLVVNKKLRGAALKHYTPTFLKNFKGADLATWAHLINIKFNYDHGVSGGHDKAIFDKFALDNGIDVYDRRAIGSNEKVKYRSYWSDGSEAETGSKTLIPNLSAKRNTMLTDVNAALWNSVAKCEFNPSVARWEATSAAGKSFDGYYRNGNIDTFFPT
jgi:hypothetical protein